MEQFELVEKLVLKTGVTYEDAKLALEACNWDMLDAVVYLEKLGKVKNGAAYYKTNTNEKKTTFTDQEKSKGVNFGEVCGKIVNFVGNLVDLGNRNYVDISHKGKHVITLSMTVMMIFLLLGFWAIIPLMIVGLFFGFKYHFRGTGNENEINDLLNKASDAAENVKEQMKGNQE